jgi:hypothetical protein
MIRYAPIFAAHETLLQLCSGIIQGSIGNMPKRTKNTTTDLVFLFIKKKNLMIILVFLLVTPTDSKLGGAWSVL